MQKRAFFLFALCTCGCVGSALLLRTPAVHAAQAAAPAPIIPVPQDYREWTYLSSGLDMTYTAPANTPMPPNHDGLFDNVFVTPDSYRTFVRTGTWPSKTVFVLENRAAKSNVSINKAGRTQGAEVTGVELHVKTGDQWAFYARNADGTEHLIARPASCYTCHEAHAAVDTTFVQFYPTLLPLAQSKHVLSANYVAETVPVAK